MLRVAAKNLGFGSNDSSNFRFEKNVAGSVKDRRSDMARGWVGDVLGADMELRKLFLAEPCLDSAIMVADQKTPGDVCLYFMANDRVFKIVDGQDGDVVCKEQNAGVQALPPRAQEEIQSMAAKPGCALALVVPPGYESRENFRSAMQRASETIKDILLKQSPASVRAAAEKTLSVRPAVEEMVPA
jgi:hypothetical protein